MTVIINGDTGIDKITDGSVVQADLASGITVDSLSTASGSAPSYSARAWVNFNGTGTIAIRESGNVSSLIDVASGRYTINFTTDMPDANYSTIVTCNQPMGNAAQNVASGIDDTGSTTSPNGASLYTTSAVRVGIQASDGGNDDMPDISVAVFR